MANPPRLVADDPPPERPQLSPLVVDARSLAKLLGCGLRTLRSHDAGGKIPAPLRIGGRVVWLLRDIEGWLTAGAPSRATWQTIKAARK